MKLPNLDSSDSALTDGAEPLSILHTELVEAVLTLMQSSGLETDPIDIDTFNKMYRELFLDVRDDCEKSSLDFYKATAPKALAELRAYEAGFQGRSFTRWKPSFDHMEMIWAIAQELGEMHGTEIKADGIEDNNPVMSALAHIFPRALLVSQEIICLLKGGFPDGALARWRSLHELTVTAMYIAKHGEAAAVPYLMSFHFFARRAALQMNEHSERGETDRFSDEDLRGFDERCAEAEKVLGRKISKDKEGEWPSINAIHRTFAAIEKDVRMEHWRPRYRWASTHTHANHRPMDKLLGMAESDGRAHLVGASNSGFVDPFHMTAITLAQVTATYLSHGGNADRIVHANVIRTLAVEMGAIAMENERATWEAFEGNDRTESGLKN
jgi:hypothetical protein